MSTFNSFAEFLQAAYRNSKHGIQDERLITQKSAGMNSTVNFDGGYLVSKPIVGPILESAQQKSLLWKKSVKLETKSYGALIPRLYETARDDSMNGKMAYWVGEGVSKTTDYPRVTQSNLKLNKLCVLLPVTDELMEDSVLLQQWIDGFVAQRIAWVVDKAILYGNPSTSMNGIMGPGADGVIAVAEANPLDEDTLENFCGALAPANEAGAEWYMSKENWDDIQNAATTFMNKHELVIDNGQWYLYGHKLNVMEQMTSALGDLVLGDFSNYFTLSMGDPIKSVSIQFKFTTDQTYIRWVIRLNGDSFGQVYTTADTTSVAPFVIPIGTAPTMSSSSSSGDSGSSSTSSSSSTSYVEGWSSTSSKSNSSASSSSSSSSSSTDASISSRSSDSSKSLSSKSTDSSDSESTDSSSSSSQSSGAVGPCNEQYVASGFATSALNGTYVWGGRYNSRAWYGKTGKYLFWSSGLSVWAIANTLGSAPAGWLTMSDTGTACPNNTYNSESGTVA